MLDLIFQLWQIDRMMIENKNSNSATTLTGLAYRQFKKALLSGEIEGGANLSQSEICEILGQSISPVREALKLLQHEGFVKILPRSGIQVLKPDLALFRDCHQFRVMLELSAIETYVDTTPDSELKALEAQQIEHLEKNQERLPLAVLRPAQMLLEKRLHFGVIQSLKNDIVTANYSICLEKLNLIRIDQGGFTNTQMIKTAHEHLAVIRAAVKRDPIAARAELDAHLRNSLQRAMGAVS